MTDRQLPAMLKMEHWLQLSRTCAMPSTCIMTASEFLSWHAASHMQQYLLLLSFFPSCSCTPSRPSCMQSCMSSTQSCMSCTPTCCRTGWRQDAKGTGRELTTDLKAKKSIAKLSSSGQFRLHMCQLSKSGSWAVCTPCVWCSI